MKNHRQFILSVLIIKKGKLAVERELIMLSF